MIAEKLASVYKGKKVEKGLAFPTCVSLNNCCGHFSPLKEDSIELKAGDVCKMCVSLSHTRLSLACFSVSCPSARACQRSSSQVGQVG